MVSLLQVIHMIIGLYMWLVFISFILNWLTVFNVVNTRNGFIAGLGDFLYRITEPLIRPIRKVVPLVNGIDLAPLALWCGLLLLLKVIENNIHFFM